MMSGSLNVVHFNRFFSTLNLWVGPLASLKAHPTRLKIIEKLECSKDCCSYYFFEKELKWMMTAPKFMTGSLENTRKEKKPTYKFFLPLCIYAGFSLLSFLIIRRRTPTHRPTWKAQISVSHGAAAALVLVGF